MTTENTLARVKSPIPTSVQSEQKKIPDHVMPLIAKGEDDDRAFDRIFATIGDELLEEMIIGLRHRFTRLMVEKYISDDTISDGTLASGLRQIPNAAMELEDGISFLIEAEILSYVDQGAATSLSVSIAQELRDMDW